MTSISVVICAYTEDRWDHLEAAVRSVAEQRRPAQEIIVVVDHNRALFARAAATFDATVVRSTGRPGLADARNTGLATATGDVVAFLDDDAFAEEDWLEAIASAYADPRVIGVGGVVAARWSAVRPRSFPDEFLWVVGCSYRGLPVAPAEVRNLLGANMSFRREAFSAAGGFRSELGRVRGRPAGCEETEFCIRLRRARPDGVLLYQPAARVIHHVPSERTSFRYFRSRCYHEGRSKAIVAALSGRDQALATERAYTTQALPAAIRRGIGEALRGDPAGLVRATAVLVGFFVTTAGFMIGAASLRLRGAREDQHVSVADDWVTFDVHGRLGIRVQRSTPTTPLLLEMLEGFVAAGPVRDTSLTIVREQAGLRSPSHAEDAFDYTEGGVHYASDGVTVTVEGEGLVLSGRGELLTTVLPLLDWLMTDRGAPMVHAATLEVDGRGVCIGAWGGAGKTSTVAKFMGRTGCSFMGDDWAFLGRDGALLGFAKPMFMKSHHRAIYPELFASKRKPLVPRQLTRPVNRVATAVHPLITRYPRLAGVTRRWSPEHWVVSPRRVFGSERISSSAPLALAVFLERHDGLETTVEPRSEGWMASRLVANFHAEMTRRSQDVLTALGASSMHPLDAHFAAKARDLRAGLTGVPCHLLRVPVTLSADDASDVIVEEITKLLESR